MRVIAGSARRLLLKTLPGNDTRPTTDMIKETLFNMINFDLPGSRFLDLYAGSGAIGIEALSRGASFCTFVDNNAKAAAVIRENVEHTHFTEQSDIITSEAVSALRRIEKTSESYDVIDGLADKLLSYGTRFYTCHCTGSEAFARLKMRMKDRVEYFACGDVKELL